MQPHETAKMCFMLSAAFPAWKASDATIEMYHAMLQDLDSEIVMRATQDWILTSEKFPTIAGIRNKCAEVAGVLAPSATEAWGEVMAVCESYGIYQRRPDWSHPTIADVVKTMGYQHICQTDNIATVRAQFIKMYGELSAKANGEIVIANSFALGGGRVALPNSTVVKSLSA